MTAAFSIRTGTKHLYVVRDAAAGDAEAIAALESAAFGARSWGRAGVLEGLATPSAIAIIAGPPADHNPSVFGFAFFRRAADEAEILTIGVDPARRRRGVGAALVGGVLQHPALRGADRLFLEVAEENAGAIALYRKAGFVEIGRRENYYPDGASAVVMCRRVKSG